MARNRSLDVWPLVHDERAALLATLEGLTPQQWETPSLCAGWSVRDVAAHLAGNAGTTFSGMVAAMLRARFDFDEMNAQGVARHRGETPSDVLALLRERARSTRTPPVDRASRLVEEVVHGEDVRRPLGLVRHYPVVAVVPALEYQLRTSDAVGGSKQHAAGLRLVATDADFVHTPRGAVQREVSGPAVDLLLAACRRIPWPD